MYNESKRFNYQHWYSILENNSSVNFLFVDDNSTDDVGYLYNLRKNFTNVHYLKLEKSFYNAYFNTIKITDYTALANAINAQMTANNCPITINGTSDIDITISWV